jgi:hypothetical protein
MTCLLKADWYIIPQRLETDYTRDAVLRHSGRKERITQHTTNVVPPRDIPFEEYDVVITFDPILDVPNGSRTLFAYYVQEHWDPLYSQSLKGPIGKYDLFLSHMMDSEQKLTSLPQSVSFPYLRAPNVSRATFLRDKEDAVWVDWRMLTNLAATELWNEAAEDAATRLKEMIELPIRYKGDFNKNPYGIADLPSWGDAADYLEAIGRCTYYISIGRSSGAGQGLCDAASLSCICFGETSKVYHALVCHQAGLCANTAEMSRGLRELVSSRHRQREMVEWQDEAMREHFARRPIAILEKAIAIKRKSLSFAKIFWI